MSPQLQLLPPVPPPIGLYIRPGWSDHVVLQQLIVEGKGPTGIVFDARFGVRHRDLWDGTIDAGLDAVLDPGVQELWSPAGRFLNGLASVSWTWIADQGEPALRGDAGRRLAESLADHALAAGFTSILSPTHYLQDPEDRILEVDVLLTRNLREALDARGATSVRVYYPLAMQATALGTPTARAIVLDRLRGLDVDAVWLRLHPFGTSASGPRSLRRYIDVCSDLATLGVPIVAERTGTVGLALLSFNLVGGIECGVTVGEAFDATRLLRRDPESTTPFSNPGMVYLPALDTFVTRRDARTLLGRRATKAAVGCRDGDCCRRGPDDMLRDARRHGVTQRVREVVDIGKTPPHRRPERYLARVTIAGNLAARLATAHPVLEPARKRLDSWRGTLSALPADTVRQDAPPAAVGRRLAGKSAAPHLRSIPAQRAK